MQVKFRHQRWKQSCLCLMHLQLMWVLPPSRSSLCQSAHAHSSLAFGAPPASESREKCEHCLCWKRPHTNTRTKISVTYSNPHLACEQIQGTQDLPQVLPYWRMPPSGMSRIVQELCESQGGHLGLSVLTSLMVSVDIKQYWTRLTNWSQLVPNMSTDIPGH